MSKKKLFFFAVFSSFSVYLLFNFLLNQSSEKISENFNPKCPHKILICGIGKNVAKASANTIASIEALGKSFIDYRVIVYENNSTDETKSIYASWAKKNSKVIFISENLSQSKFKKVSKMKIIHRIEKIAYARNKVLEKIQDPKFSDFSYVIWADLDFMEPWSVDEIIATINHPEKDFDAVFANGSYDLFALRSKQFPVGFELIGTAFFQNIEKMQQQLNIGESQSWIDVYSAFGGLGVYKREALLGSCYSATVTKDLESQVKKWLLAAQYSNNPLFFQEYCNMCLENKVVEFSSPYTSRISDPSDVLGMKFKGGDIVWFSCTEDATLPWTCEHVTLHASMAEKGFDRFFINPKIKTSWIPNEK